MKGKFHVMVVNGGGRETAVLYKLLQAANVFVSVIGGLSGMLAPLFLNEEERSRVKLYPDISPKDIKAICELARKILPDMAFIGPETFLIMGGADNLDKICPVFGFNKSGARLEGSKIFAKRRYEELGFPVAMGTMVRSVAEGYEVLERFKNQGIFAVLKCDTEAGGKGVRIVPIENHDVPGWDHWEAQKQELALMMDPKKPLGFYAPRVVIELRYPIVSEWSAMSILGKNGFWLGLMPTLDHKLFNGLNSGGMGTVTPAPGFSMQDMETRKAIVLKLHIYLQEKYGTELCGILYEGLNRMGLVDYLVEVNCRGGDPETQVQLDWLLGVYFHEILLAAYEGDTSILSKIKMPENQVEVGIVMASKGYPGDYSAVQGKEIKLPEELPPGGKIIPSGLVWENGRFYLKGSRSFMAIGRSMNPDRKKAQAEAREIALEIVNLVEHDGVLDWRPDIGAVA